MVHRLWILKALQVTHQPNSKIFIFPNKIITLFGPKTFTMRLVYLIPLMRCDNIIPGMALWKQNLLTCSLGGCCHLQNNIPVKLCTSRHDGATVRNSLPEYLTVTSCCTGCQEFFVPSVHFFLILERAGWLSWMVHFCNEFLSQVFTASSCTGALVLCHG
jgi:hypothetical protein